MKMKRLRKEIAAVFAGTMLCFSSMAFAAASLPIEVNQSYCLNAGDTIVRMAIGNPDIADVTMASATEALVVGKASGATTLIVWTSGGGRQEYQVRVGTKDSNLEYILSAEMNLPNVHVQRVDKNIMLSGSVTNQYEHDLAIKLASLYGSKDSVVDMLQMTNPSQINIEVQVIEVSDRDAKDLGIQYGNLSSSLGTSANGSTATVTTDADGNTVTNYNGVSLPTIASSSVADTGVFSFGQDNVNSHESRYWLFNHFSNINAKLTALVTNNKARILSRPNVTTMSGETANILVGGKIPIPVPNTNGTSNTIQWQDYGIKLEIKPVVDKDNNITSSVHASVSDLDYTRTVTTSGASVPGMTTREATSSVNIPSGMTMAIGGLMNTTDVNSITRIPLLSNIPIIGELFKYRTKSRDNREIIILITPRLVNETTNAAMGNRMYETYNEGQEAEKKRHQVDLNKPQNTDSAAEDKSFKKPAEKTPVSEPEQKVQEQPDQAVKSDASKETQSDDSILGKYLNRNVLPKEKSTK